VTSIARRERSAPAIAVTCRIGSRSCPALRVHVAGAEHICFTDRPEDVPDHWIVRPIEFWASSDRLTQSWIESHLTRLVGNSSRVGSSSIEWIDPGAGDGDVDETSTGSRRWFGDQEVLARHARRPAETAAEHSTHGAATIVVPVHDAPDDVERCLESVTRTIRDIDRVVIVDDGSAPETAEICARHARHDRVSLIRRPTGSGFPAAANAGIEQCTTPFVIVLNSDTCVPHGWVTRLVEPLERHPEVAAVGPVSNAARFQSIPHLPHDDTDDRNRRPAGLDLETMNEFLRLWSSGIGPIRVPLLNGFCLAFRRSVLEEIGAFDTGAFPRGFGEENDWCRRATQAGHDLLVTTSVYVEHAKGRSYSPTEVERLKAEATRRLVDRYGRSALEADLTAMRYPAALVALRADTQALWDEYSRQG
jgi:GT2 family glycosyltransferase